MLRLRKPSPAMVVACISLFIGLSGVGTAAVVLAKNSVLSKHIKNGQVKRADLGANAVNTAKVGDGSLLAQDFAAGQLPAGPQGLQGPAGRSALEPLRSGETIRGVVGGDYESPATSGDFRALETFPIPAPAPLPNTSVDVDGSDETANRCTGTAANPTAPPGVVCIYVLVSSNATGFAGLGTPHATDGSPFGFMLGWGVSATGDTLVYASWAYQAP